LRDLSAGLTDLPSVRGADSASDRRAGRANSFRYGNARCDEIDQSATCLFVLWTMGYHFGVPFHSELQRRVLLAALGLLDDATPGLIVDLAIKWADVRREAKSLTAQGRRLSGKRV
jgi:hypothetical protein